MNKETIRYILYDRDKNGVFCHGNGYYFDQYYTHPSLLDPQDKL